MKTFCVLEQGKTINHPITLEKKRMFTTSFSGFYRLNWKRDDDPNAFLSAKNIMYSEGRSLLYEHVPKEYEYYIFTDEDSTFVSSKNRDVSLAIKEFLDEYKPLAGTFFDIYGWHFRRVKSRSLFVKICHRLIDTILDHRGVHPILGYNELVEVYSKSFADVVFPVPFHGDERATWYSRWICYNLYPMKQMCFREIRVFNNFREDHEYPVDNRRHGDYIIELFNEDTYTRSFDYRKHWNNPGLRKLNLSVMFRKVDKRYVEFSLNDLKKIYNINNDKFLARSSKNNLQILTKIL